MSVESINILTAAVPFQGRKPVRSTLLFADLLLGLGCLTHTYDTGAVFGT